jgi:multiple sugar transport system permease protein
MEMKRPGIKISYGLLVIILAILTLTTIYPLYWMYSGGLKTSQELIQTPPTLLPEDARWENYPEAWSNLNYSLYFTNTLLLAIGALFFQFVVSATAAYSLSKLKPVGSSVVLFLFLSTLMVPPEAYLIPQYLAVVRVPLLGLRLVDTWWAVWLPRAINAFHIFILKSFFDEVPQDLMDAARIDGARPGQIFLRILIPLSTAVLAVVAIFTVIAQWKDFFWPFLVLKSTHLQPIMVALFRLTNQSNPEPMSIIVAGLAIASTPMIILFLIFQRQILRGITLTGLKG